MLQQRASPLPLLTDVRRLLPLVVLVLVLAPSAHAAGPSLILGANEALMLQKTLVGAKANMSLAKLAGFRAVSVREFWWPELKEPRKYDQTTLGNVEKAAGLLGMPVFLSVANTAGRFAPRTEEARQDFSDFAAATAKQFRGFHHIIIGNEPNKNQFWAPQFGDDGSDTAAVEYERLLADVYDGLKAVSPSITVIGGAVSPRGGDNPSLPTKAHSPTTFIRDLGNAYRASGRGKPIMDWFSFHPYQDNSSQSPSFRHGGSPTITLADYDKLVRVLGQAFDGTNQAGSSIPLIYNEYGIESTIPAKKAKKYKGSEPSATKPVSPKVQGQRYREAVALAFCQRTVKAMFLFHAFDEPGRPQWQSGLFYVDHTAKPSLALARKAFAEARRGVVARCPGLRLAVKATTKFPSPTQASSAGKRGTGIGVRVRCDLDCRYEMAVVTVPAGRSVLAGAGQVVGGKKTLVRLPKRSLAKGRYRLNLSLVAAVNPGPAVRRSSRSFLVR